MNEHTDLGDFRAKVTKPESELEAKIITKRYKSYH